MIAIEKWDGKLCLILRTSLEEVLDVGEVKD